MKTHVLFVLLVGGALAAPSTRSRPHRPIHPLTIVGGNNVTLGELPYQVNLQDISYGFPYHFCGGSIKSELWVVTAAHCVDDIDANNPDFIQAVAGEVDQVVNEASEQVIILSRIIIHENYDGFAIINDIALLKLSSSLTFNEFVQPLPLPPVDHNSQGDCVVSGWGSTTEGGDPSEILQKVTLPVWSDHDCGNAYPNEIEAGMFCAGVTDGGQDACGGDSGGPLACDDLPERYLAGIVSWGYGCGQPGFPGVYTKVSHYVDWINSHAV
ncbi:Trypsin-1-like 9 [Homarus americanus]|uniref:Trypsin-1-like 9 n=2 Tax=Homarus americanus TaxID=6706 RepID=A0A8J5K5V7_HOMAM|nr:Trypsin-1-like 9 [Homarus americanus]